jgi:hypothetical protein
MKFIIEKTLSTETVTTIKSMPTLIEEKSVDVLYNMLVCIINLASSLIGVDNVKFQEKYRGQFYGTHSILI